MALMVAAVVVPAGPRTQYLQTEDPLTAGTLLLKACKVAAEGGERRPRSEQEGINPATRTEIRDGRASSFGRPRMGALAFI